MSVSSLLAILPPEKLVEQLFPFLTGLLFFGMFGVYEVQGPLMGWWVWPKADGLLMPNVDLWQFGPLGADKRGMVISEHAAEALNERVFGFPILAPYFHSAFGWGISVSLRLLVPSFQQNIDGHQNLGAGTVAGILASVILGPAFGMLWDPPIRVFEWCLGASKASSAPTVMALTFIIPLFLGPTLSSPRLSWRSLLLFSVVLLHHSFHVSNALFRRGRDVIPGDLKMFVCAVSFVGVMAVCMWLTEGVIYSQKKKE